jgi:AcrR family transcriptional regulator
LATAAREPGSRRDAQRNRGLLVAAARSVFAERGVDARVDEVARRAGVGTGTLYRHFPTREALLEAIFAERIGELVTAADAALAEPDAWVGLVGFLEATLEPQSGDRVLKEIFLRYPAAENRLTESRQQIYALLERLLERGHSQGVLRADFALPDLALALWSFAPLIAATADTAPTVWRRHLHWLLDGLRPIAATPQIEPALNDQQLSDAMHSFRQHRFPRKQRRATPSPKPNRS